MTRVLHETVGGDFIFPRTVNNLLIVVINFCMEEEINKNWWISCYISTRMTSLHKVDINGIQCWCWTVVTVPRSALHSVLHTENFPQLSSDRAQSSHTEHSAPTAVRWGEVRWGDTNKQPGSTGQSTPSELSWTTTCTSDIQQFYSSHCVNLPGL